MENVKKKFKVAVVGLGKMGLLHASILSVMPNVQLAALCDKSWLMRKFAKSTLDGPLVVDSLVKLSDLDLDAVYVTTPIPSHFNVIKEIYNNNIARSIFVEKTLSLNPAQSEELCNLSQKTDGVTMVGYMKRFSVTFTKARELLYSNVIGEVLSFDAYAYSSDFADVKKGSESGARGGVLEDLGSHVTDIALWFFGELHVSSAELQSVLGPNSVDSASFQVESKKSFKGNFDFSWIKEGYRMPEFGLIIKGAKGSIRVDDYELELTLDNAEQKNWYRQNLNDNVTFLLGDPEYYRESDHFIQCLVTGDKPEPSFQTAMKVDCLLEEVRSKASR